MAANQPIISVLTTTVLLVACGEGAPPKIAYDDFEQAVVDPEPPKPIEIVKVPEPVPLPGQLLPRPKPPTADKRPPTARVAAANRAALQEPSTSGYVNAVQVYPYMEGALYRLYTAPEQVSDIALQPGETLTAVSAGDTVRWVIGDTTSGEGAGRRVHVLVKPIAPGLHTNLVVLTNRRAYHLALESTGRTAMASISWTYPADEILALEASNRRAEAAAPVDLGLSLETLRFRYDITGDDPPWRPVQAFDDSSKVYIQFPRRIDQGEMPPLFVLGPGGGSELINYRVRGAYYIVDRLFAAAELRLGEEPQQVVRISRTDGQ